MHTIFREYTSVSPEIFSCRHDRTLDIPGDTDESSADAAPASPDVESLDHPERIGRYRIEKVLGQGGFGLVYLAYDEQLHRRVAVKVPHARLISKPEDAEAYLTEARTVANLDHPHIVPVYDVGTFSVLSSLPLTIRRPSGLNATLRRPLVCP